MLVGYILILLSGVAIGALGMYFGSSNLRLQKRERGVLQQRQAQLDQDYSELDSYCSRIITGLERMANECALLRQQVRSGTSRSPRFPDRLLYQSSVGTGSAMESEQSLMKAEPPCDYSDTASDLLRPSPEAKR